MGDRAVLRNGEHDAAYHFAKCSDGLDELSLKRGHWRAERWADASFLVWRLGLPKGHVSLFPKLSGRARESLHAPGSSWNQQFAAEMQLKID